MSPELRKVWEARGIDDRVLTEMLRGMWPDLSLDKAWEIYERGLKSGEIFTDSREMRWVKHGESPGAGADRNSEYVRAGWNHRERR